MTKPPQFPWIKGVQPDYRAFAMRLFIAQTNDNNVWSLSDFEDEQDQQTSLTLPSHGVEQIAFGFLCEAARREAYLQVLIQLTQDINYVDKFHAASPEDKQKMLDALQEAAKRRAHFGVLKGQLHGGF